MAAILVMREGRSFAVVREERGVRTTIESGLDWDEALSLRLREAKREEERLRDAEAAAPVPAPLFAHQPGRRKFKKPSWFQKSSRSLIAERRPRCPQPHCGQYMPASTEARDGWADCYGHYDLRGEPCPSFRGLTTDTPAPVRLEPVRVLQEAPANTNAPRAKPKPKRKRPKKHKGRRPRRRWVQIPLIETPVVAREPRVRLVRPAAVPSVAQLSLDEWLATRMTARSA